MRLGHHVAAVPAGSLEALLAADMLAAEGIEARVLDCFTIQPLDTDCVVESAEATGCVVTAENHNVIGGLGSAVAEVIAEQAPAALVRVGLQDVFPESGPAEELLDRYHMSVDDIVEAAKAAMKKRDGRK